MYPRGDCRQSKHHTQIYCLESCFHQYDRQTKPGTRHVCVWSLPTTLAHSGYIKGRQAKAELGTEGTLQGTNAKGVSTG